MASGSGDLFEVEKPRTNSDDGRPALLSSALDYAQDWLADRHYVGGKAVGLFALPRDWVPPFLVLTSGFHSLWRCAGTTEAVLALLEDEEKLLIQQLVGCSTRLATTVMVRSNSPDEGDLATRGSRGSYPVAPSIDAISGAVDRLFAAAGGEATCGLLQLSISPGVVGHMSNERRVSNRKSTWLVEGLHPNAQVLIGANHKIDGQAALTAKTDETVLDRLRTVAGTLVGLGDGYYHCEWVWGGTRVWIVQRDTASPGTRPCYANSYVDSMDNGFPERLQDLVLLEHFADVPEGRWRKLRRPCIFAELGMPVADVYVLTGEAWKESTKDNHHRLLADLALMSKHPLVVRCDIAPDAHMDEDLLPTSDPLNDAAAVIGYMEEAAVFFEERSVGICDWALLLASLIPARASAMAQAFPKGMRVRIDALWGFPDGLLYFPHDSYFFRTDTRTTKQSLRFKGICWLYRDAAWSTEAVAPPLDWSPVLNREEVETISSWAQKLADRLDHQVQLMVLCRIGGKRGRLGCMPFHYTMNPVEPYGQSLRVLPRGRDITTVSSSHDLGLASQDDQARPDGYFIQPETSLIRDTEFIRSVAELAKRRSRPLYFQGSLLGHAYYIMTQAGANVTPITTDEPGAKPTKYDKLVRDEIPVIVDRAGGLARVRMLSRDQARLLLRQKLLEESFEAWNAEPDTLVDELADVIEVVEAICNQSGISPEEVAQNRDEKRAKRGGFDKLVYLEETAVRPLSQSLAQTGDLPLDLDTPSPPHRSGTRTESYVHIDVPDADSEWLTVTMPLIPPIERFAVVNPLKVETDDLELEARYVGSRVEIRMRRPSPKVSSLQLSLFDDGF